MTDYTERFEKRVWTQYPKRDGRRSGKIPAFKQWNRLSEKQKLHVIDQIEKRNRYDGWGKYIKDCERWLRDHADDEFEVPRSYSDPQAIDIPEKESPKETDPAKSAFNRVMWNCLMQRVSAGNGAWPPEKLPEIIRLRDYFAVVLKEAWDKGESLDGVKEAFISQLEDIVSPRSEAA